MVLMVAERHLVVAQGEVVILLLMVAEVMLPLIQDQVEVVEPGLLQLVVTVDRE